MSELPPPIRLPGEPDQPRVPRSTSRRPARDEVVAVDDLYGAEAAARQLNERLAGSRRLPRGGRRTAVSSCHRHSSATATGSRDCRRRPPRSSSSAHTARRARASWVRCSSSYVRVIPRRSRARGGTPPIRSPTPHASLFALAAEAAALTGHFWPLTRELLRLHHHAPRDLHAAMLRAGVDPDRALAAMRAGTGADRIADDVASALASGVIATPALFVDGERWRADLDPELVSGALQAVLPRA